jgi:hypothetical protein
MVLKQEKRARTDESLQASREGAEPEPLCANTHFGFSRVERAAFGDVLLNCARLKHPEVVLLPHRYLFFYNVLSNEVKFGF